MQIKSTNISIPKTVIWNDQPVQTGIYKHPTNTPIFLGKSDVKDDSVIDRKYHGGAFKACYLFSENQYAYWKSLYHNLNWDWGMFGENLTVSGFDETKIYVGDIYKVGSAVIQVTEPREPCWKLGIKFGSQGIIKQFIKKGFPGTYVRVLEEGYVTKGDQFQLIEQASNSITVYQFFNLLFSSEKDQNLLKKIIKSDSIPPKKRKDLKQFVLY
ncbi:MULTISPECIES: MOSC domain-containing protein [Aestuariibaculum]|uniref:MOSC domain-containing protein n=1 Tax=Aestuariibaculum lutulentum TaxID=2920935 RepID=A0ABS9REC3_9FLAO|nr:MULTISPECIES: MOSC domain-containing protein [Aestuariibaculum]MCH4551290.1 MOSC domain-containing protein [Aestuariibaculum lutulentum]MCR8666410.1 MOSC domain-containing protein [Aestuariibaculum sp. M13]